MPARTRKDLEQSLKQGQIEPFYYLYGAEAFLRDRAARTIADAVIDGVVKSFGFSGVLLDDKGRARIFEVTVTAAVTVRDQHDNRVLYDNQNFVFRGEFEFANDPRNFFNEEDPAVMRIARSFAESIVSTLVNGFGVKE